MRGTFGILIGVIFFAIGLAGLGEALAQMMTHSDPNSSLKAAGGLGVFVAVGLVSMFMAR